MSTAATLPDRTTAPGRYVALYDGHCVFCAAGAHRLARIAKAGTLELRSFQDPGALDPFPGITHEACMVELHLVAPDGRVFRGAEALARAFETRPVMGVLAKVYYVPGFRQLADLGYALTAKYRYWIMGKKIERGECSTACAIHVKKRPGAGVAPKTPAKQEDKP